jgi:hypothetical protein
MLLLQLKTTEMKLCMDCKHYGGVKQANGKYICNNPLNCFQHPVDGLEHAYDASWLRMAPELQSACGMEGNWWEKKDATA